MTVEKEPKQKLTLEQKIEQQEQKLKQLKAQKQAAEAREKARKKEQDRTRNAAKCLITSNELFLSSIWIEP